MEPSVPRCLWSSNALAANICRLAHSGRFHWPLRNLFKERLALVSISQNGERYPLDGLDGAEALRAAVEADNPGYGDQFIKHLALAHYNYHFRRLDDLAGNSAGPSALSAGGKRRGKSNGATAKSGP